MARGPASRRCCRRRADRSVSEPRRRIARRITSIELLGSSQARIQYVVCRVRTADKREIAVASIYVIHENDAWVEPLRAAFASLGLPYEEWFLSEGSVDLDRPPPE